MPRFPGGQVVAGSNPVSPTEEHAGQGVFLELPPEAIWVQFGTKSVGRGFEPRPPPLHWVFSSSTFIQRFCWPVDAMTCAQASRTACSASFGETVRRVWPASWFCQSASVGAVVKLCGAGGRLVGP